MTAKAVAGGGRDIATTAYPSKLSAYEAAADAPQITLGLGEELSRTLTMERPVEQRLPPAGGARPMVVPAVC